MYKTCHVPCLNSLLKMMNKKLIGSIRAVERLAYGQSGHKQAIRSEVGGMYFHTFGEFKKVSMT